MDSIITTSAGPDTATWLHHFVEALASNAAAEVRLLFGDPLVDWDDVCGDEAARALLHVRHLAAIDAARWLAAGKRPSNPFRDPHLARVYRDEIDDERERLLYEKYGGSADD